MYINKWQWAGHLGADVKAYPPTDPKDRHFLTFSVAQTKYSRRLDGSRKETTTWVDCKANFTPDRTAALTPRLIKGAHVLVEGTYEVEKKTIEGVERTFTYMLVQEIQFFPITMRANDPAPSEPTPRRAEEENPDAFNPAKFGP